MANLFTWKEKILDYEIETCPERHVPFAHLDAWKEKILDYEIETEVPVKVSGWRGELEKKRFSITRLKRH